MQVSPPLARVTGARLALGPMLRSEPPGPPPDHLTHKDLFIASAVLAFLFTAARGLLAAYYVATIR